MNAIKLMKEVKPSMGKQDVTHDTFKYVELLWFRLYEMVKKLHELEQRTADMSRTRMKIRRFGQSAGSPNLLNRRFLIKTIICKGKGI
jgi:hypothetical protein